MWWPFGKGKEQDKYRDVLPKVHEEHRTAFIRFMEKGKLESEDFCQAINAGDYDDAINEAFAIRFPDLYIHHHNRSGYTLRKILMLDASFETLPQRKEAERKFDVKKHLPPIVILCFVAIILAALVGLIKVQNQNEKKVQETSAQLHKIMSMAPLIQKDTEDFKNRVSKDLHNDAWGNPIDMTYYVDEFHTAFVVRSWGIDEIKGTDDDIVIKKEKSHIAKGVGENVSKGAIQMLKGAYKGAKEEIVGE